MKKFAAAIALLLLVWRPVGSTEVIQIGRIMTPCWEDAVFCYGEATGCKGLINSRGEIVHEFPVELESVGGFYEGLMDARYLDKGVGFVDTRGRWVIKPRFEMAKRFSGGLAPARMNRLWGYVDRKGRWVIEPQFEEAEPFGADGSARVYVGAWDSEERRAGFIDRQGNWLIEPTLYEAKDFGDGVAWAITDGPCWTDWPFGYGMNPLWYVYGGGREWVRLDPPHPKDDGVPACSWRLINSQGQAISQAKFEDVDEFSEGLAAVKIHGKWGYIDTHGVLRIPARYASALPFSEGLAAVQEFEGGPSFFIDEAGVVKLQGFMYARSFQDGLARVYLGHERVEVKPEPADARYVFIDHEGNPVIDPAPRGATSFCNGLSSVLVKDYPLEAPYETSYIDKKGRTVFHWKWTLYP